MSKLKEMRQKANLTQLQLAEKTELNVRTIQHYEQGSKIFDHARLDTILRICIALECKMSDVIENDDYVALINEYEKSHS